ncbi:MAG: AAA family ATPase [Melioribacteraceae bacterium]|nr:AAA family ATPase [Melioribacteraceae bacterium]MCO6474476.1 AAA family ATPase [Melioribacteraceae bacterium]
MAYLKPSHYKTLKPEDLSWKCDLTCFDFETTSKVKPIEGIVGQKRAMKALKIGVDLRSPGYNIFITGLSGTGKFTTIKKTLEEISPLTNDLKDYAYVNNFLDEDRPMLLTFKKGKAKTFKKDMASAIKFFMEQIPQILQSEQFNKKKESIINEYRSSQEKLMKDFEKKLSDHNLTVGQIKMGEIVAPDILAVINDEAVSIPQLAEMVAEKQISKEKADEFVKYYGEFRDEFQKIIMQTMQVQKEIQTRISNLEQETVKEIINYEIKELKKKYKDDKTKQYLDQVAENIPNNLEVFKGRKPAQEQTESGLIVDYLKEYDVNILLDNSSQDKCPVIIETTPNYSNLFGTIEKYSDGMGGWHADFTRVKAGSLLRANGGYLVINAIDAFTEPGVWKALKRVLMYGKLEIQDIANLYQFSPSILQPEPIQITTKVIMIGNNYIYSVLSGYENDFNKIFKIKAEFDYEIKRTNEALVEYARVIKKLVDQESLLEFDISGVGRIAEHGARYAGQKDKLTTRFAYIADLARESSYWARDNGSDIISDYHVDQAFEAMKERHGLYESKITEMITEGTLLIDTKGKRVGQVNGLAVYGGNQFAFGKPTRITASVGIGNGSIINVDREAGLSGNTHNKGVLIIGGYFREKFGKKIPLSFSASLVFEQGYGMIDGDSASITEICALLSSISEIPINQSFAITGSVNQKGDIQPIGGVNEKIEGFFSICEKQGLTGSQGVIIPKQNVKDLMLDDKVIEAVKNNKFKIYAISTVDDAAELLMGVKAGDLLKTGHYRKNTIFGEVEKRLVEFKEKSKPKSQTHHHAKKSAAEKGKKKA